MARFPWEVPGFAGADIGGGMGWGDIGMGWGDISFLPGGLPFLPGSGGSWGSTPDFGIPQISSIGGLLAVLLGQTGGSNKTTTSTSKTPTTSTTESKVDSWLSKYWPLLATLGGGAGLGLLASAGVKGPNGKAIMPRTLESFWPQYLQSFGDWLFSGLQVGDDGKVTLKGATPYPGRLTPDVSTTLLPSVWSSYGPQTQKVQDMMTQLMTMGGVPGAPGYQAMRTALEYGIPSQAGTFSKNIATYGAPTPEIQNLMAGYYNSGNPATVFSQFLTAPARGSWRA